MEINKAPSYTYTGGYVYQLQFETTQKIQRLVKIKNYGQNISVERRLV